MEDPSRDQLVQLDACKQTNNTHPPTDHSLIPQQLALAPYSPYTQCGKWKLHRETLKKGFTRSEGEQVVCSARLHTIDLFYIPFCLTLPLLLPDPPPLNIPSRFLLHNPLPLISPSKVLQSPPQISQTLQFFLFALSYQLQTPGDPAQSFSMGHQSVT